MVKHLRQILAAAFATAVLAVPGAAFAVDIEAGPLMGNFDAQAKCPGVCDRSGGARWSGQWHTIPGTMRSVCDCQGGSSRNRGGGSSSSGGVQWLDAGPIFAQPQADNRCPGVCQKAGGTWDGNWNTVGTTSLCACKGVRAMSGAASSCSANDRGQCAGCRAQCGPGQRASCQEGTTANDRMRNGDTSCVATAKCGCG